MWSSGNQQRSIVHFDLDTFFVSVERLENSQLNGKPVMVGGTTDRGVVAACSYEARAFGIHSGMSMKIARRLCPQGIVIRGDSGKYFKHSKIITEILKENVPKLEKASVDEFYFDMTGMDRLFGVAQFSYELRDKIRRETGLPMSMGISENKTVSKVATGESKPNGKMLVEHGREQDFLAPLSVQKLPMVGKETTQILSELGIHTIRTVQQMPRHAMEKILGKNGETLWMRAKGIDTSPVKEFFEQETLSLERTFDLDTIDVVKLRNFVIAMTEGLAYQLRLGHKVTACIAVKMKYSDMETNTMQQRIPYTSCDHHLLPVALQLFDKLFARRKLVRLIGVKISHLVHGGHQIDLLGDAIEKIQLYQELDYLRTKYRDSCIVTRASVMDLAFGVGNPWTGERPTPPAHRHV